MTTATTINGPRHPQILFRGFLRDDPRLLRMRELAGASHLLEGEGLDGLRPGDWDVLVVEGAAVPPAVPERVCVLAFDSPAMGRMAGHQATMHFTGRQPSPTMHLSSDLGPPMRELLEREAVPWLESQPIRPFLQEVPSPRPSYGYPFPPRDLDERAVADCRGMVVDADGHLLVGAFPRAKGGWCWAVPYRSDRPERWLSAALESWREDDRTRFAHREPWLSRERWATPRERAARAELGSLRARRSELLQDLDERERELEAAVLAAAEEGEQGARRLLTHAGHDLVQAAVDGFVGLGFEVLAVDTGRVVDGVAVVEDLSLTAPEDPQARIILDVVGHAGESVVDDLLVVSQHAAATWSARGRAPTGRGWSSTSSRASIPTSAPTSPGPDPATSRPSPGVAGSSSTPASSSC